MIIIRSQEEFNEINVTIASLPSNGELIRIIPTEDNTPYLLTSPILVQRSNVIIEGVGKPIIQSTIVDTTLEGGSIIVCKGTSATPLENITIRGLNLIGGKVNTKGSCGIYCAYVGKSFTTGLTSGTYSRYDASTNGAPYINKIGITIKDCVIQSNKDYGVYLTYSSNNMLVGNTLMTNSIFGLYLLTSCNSNIVTGNTVQYNNNVGIYLSTNGSNNFTGNIIKNNNGRGIYLSLSNNNVILDNNIQNNYGAGISISNSSNNTLTGNIVQNNYDGISLTSTSNNNTITGNIIQNNNGTGVYLGSSSSNCSVVGNEVLSNNSNGIHCNSSNACITISGNTVMYNVGTGIFTGTERNCVYSNIVTGNTVSQYSVTGSGSIFSMSLNI